MSPGGPEGMRVVLSSSSKWLQPRPTQTDGPDGQKQIVVVAAVTAAALPVLFAVFSRTASKTSAAWLARRTPRAQALPSPTGLRAGAPAGRQPDGVRTAQLLGARAGGMRCDAHAGPHQACSRRSSCALATGVLLVLRARVPAPPEAFGKDWG